MESSAPEPQAAAERLLLVTTQCPDANVADRIAAALVEARLVACATRAAAVQSVYRWQGRVESAPEVPLTLKTRESLYRVVEQAIRELHPYQVPEIVAVPVEHVAAPYRRWVWDETEAGAWPAGAGPLA